MCLPEVCMEGMESAYLTRSLVFSDILAKTDSFLIAERDDSEYLCFVTAWLVSLKRNACLCFDPKIYNMSHEHTIVGQKCVPPCVSLHFWHFLFSLSWMRLTFPTRVPAFGYLIWTIFSPEVQILIPKNNKFEEAKKKEAW